MDNKNVDYLALLLKSKNLLSESEKLIDRQKIVMRGKKKLFEDRGEEMMGGVGGDEGAQEGAQAGTQVNVDSDKKIDRDFLIDFILKATPDFNINKKFDKQNVDDVKYLSLAFKKSIDVVQKQVREVYEKENKEKIERIKGESAQKFNEYNKSSKILGYEERHAFLNQGDSRKFILKKQNENYFVRRGKSLLFEQEQNGQQDSAVLQLKEKYYNKSYGDFLGDNSKLLFTTIDDVEAMSDKDVEGLNIVFDKYKVPNSGVFFDVMSEIKSNPTKLKNISKNMIFIIDAIQKVNIDDDFNPVDFLKSLNVVVAQQSDDVLGKRENLRKLSEYICQILKIDIQKDQSADVIKKLIADLNQANQQIKSFKLELNNVLTKKVDMNSWANFSNYIIKNKKDLSKNVILNFIFDDIKKSDNLADDIEQRLIFQDIDVKMSGFDDLLKKKIFDEFEIEMDQFSDKYKDEAGNDFDASKLIIWDSDLSDPKVIDKIKKTIVQFDRSQGSGDDKLDGNELRLMIQKFQIIKGVFESKINLPIGYSFVVSDKKDIDFVLKIDEVLYKAMIEQKDNSDVVKKWFSDADAIIATFNKLNFNYAEYEMDLKRQPNDTSHFYYVIHDIFSNKKYEKIFKEFENNQVLQNLSIDITDEIISADIIKQIKSSGKQKIAFVFMNNGKTFNNDITSIEDVGNLQKGTQLKYNQIISKQDLFLNSQLYHQLNNTNTTYKYNQKRNKELQKYKY